MKHHVNAAHAGKTEKPLCACSHINTASVQQVFPHKFVPIDLIWLNRSRVVTSSAVTHVLTLLSKRMVKITIFTCVWAACVCLCSRTTVDSMTVNALGLHNQMHSKIPVAQTVEHGNTKVRFPVNASTEKMYSLNAVEVTWDKSVC